MVFNTHYQSLLQEKLTDNYLTFRSVSGEDFSICTGLNNTADPHWDGTMYYSTNTTSWAVWDGGPIFSVNGRLYIKGEGNTKVTGVSSSDAGCFRFAYGGDIDPSYNPKDIRCQGNLESLLDWRTVARGGHPSMADWAFTYLFFDFTRYLIEAPEMPSPVLSYGCYSNIFQGCRNLVTVTSALPAAIVPDYAYESMFSSCESLATAPTIGATSVGTAGMAYMFYNCISLISAPAITVSSIGNNGCQYMFYGCSSLTAAPELTATSIGSWAYNYMFSNCTSMATGPSILPATTIGQGCYAQMFYGCSSLTAAPSEISATYMPASACMNMFTYCYSMTTGPQLKATTFQWGSYMNMFSSCISLTTVPAIPLQTGVEEAYAGMFSYCQAINVYDHQELGTTLYYTGEDPDLMNTNIFYGCNNGTFTNTTEGVNYYISAQVI